MASCAQKKWLKVRGIISGKLDKCGHGCNAALQGFTLHDFLPYLCNIETFKKANEVCWHLLTCLNLLETAICFHLKGSLKKNVEPLPFVLSTQIFPSCRFIISDEI